MRTKGFVKIFMNQFWSFMRSKEAGEGFILKVKQIQSPHDGHVMNFVLCNANLNDNMTFPNFVN